jgi:peptide/nickel transport system ATP-binding protein
VSDAPLVISGLTVVAVRSGAVLVEDLDLLVAAGELVGLVGESGSGKTTVGLSCLGFTRPGTAIASGTVHLGGTDVLSCGEAELRALRRKYATYVPQSSGFALNPARTIGSQLRERLPTTGESSSTSRILSLLSEVALPSERAFLQRYPHELSGGQQQRVVIAASFAAEPTVVILDEPTTGLDVSTQSQILTLLRQLCEGHRTAAILISHDLGVVADSCARVAVMYSGRLVETGGTSDLLGSPQHPYTRQLVMAVPDIHGRRTVVGIPGQAPSPTERPGGCHFAPRCEYVRSRCITEVPALEMAGLERQIRCFYPVTTRLAVTAPGVTTGPASTQKGTSLEVSHLTASYGRRVVVHDVNLRVEEGTCTGLVGESGSGKTSVCRAIAGLNANYTGQIFLGGRALATRSEARSPAERKAIQYIFQNPYDALNPRRSIEASIRQPLTQFRDSLGPGRLSPNQLVELVALGGWALTRHPGQLSGGELQRVAIARALASAPSVLICDEITSSLDVSVQASIVSLLLQLRREMNLTLIFVTHNVAIVRNVAQFVAVLKDGELVEYGPTDQVFESPSHPYTRDLLRDAPDLWDTREEWYRAENRPTLDPRYSV